MKKYTLIGITLILALILVGCNNKVQNNNENEQPQEIKVTDASSEQKVEWSSATSLNLWDDMVLVNIVENDVVLDYTEKSEYAQKITLSGFEAKPKYLAVSLAQEYRAGTLYILTDTGALYLQAIPEIGESWEPWKDKKFVLDTNVEKIVTATSELGGKELCFTLKADKVIRRAGETKSYEEEVQIYNNNKNLVLGDWKVYKIENNNDKTEKGIIEVFEIEEAGTCAITNDYKFKNKIKPDLVIDNDIIVFDIFHQNMEMIYTAPGNDYSESASIELTQDDAGVNILKLYDGSYKQTVYFKK